MNWRIEMRAFRTLIIVVVLFIVCTAAKSTFRKGQGNLSKNVAINSYVYAVKHGRPATLNKVIASDAKFTVLQGTNLSDFSKQEMLANVKANKNRVGDFKASSQIVDKSTNQNVVKVDIRSNNITHNDYVTIANTGNGWKITNVYSILK